ncbi:P-loop containing nucleoside triphosphate hydrolase protein [Mycena galopus ATCC 62051]|nr:P-loop containing nucleoside triphosphate hydrolase protein [Mycena galopus ATCC 62051]
MFSPTQAWSLTLFSSSGSFSLLPAVPKIFHGRDSELNLLVESLLSASARVAILGPGGMGKTTLAVAALHHIKVADKYASRHFIPCDSAHTNDSLVAMIASNVGLNSANSARHLINHLSTGPPCLIILDNFETPWEPANSRAKVEEFLALLADVPHVGLVITMRGAERPRRVQWTHPFLRPLLPLEYIAARQTFVEIADEIHDDSELDQLLNITDRIPLAVQLIATVAASEGCDAALERWKQERTAMLSDGYDKRSNLEISISLSLSSPRMLLVPQAADLLSLMSLLPDGISDMDLAHSKPPIQDLPKCKETLIRTSLAYVGGAGEFKVLAPIREYTERVRPPSPPLVAPLRAHLSSLLKIWGSHTYLSGVAERNMTPRLVSNLGNLHNLLEYGLNSDLADLKQTMECIMLLNRLHGIMNRGPTPLLLCLPEKLDELDDPKLSGEFIISMFQEWQHSNVTDPAKCMHVGLEHFRAIKDQQGEGKHCYSCTSVVY